MNNVAATVGTTTNAMFFNIEKMKLWVAMHRKYVKKIKMKQ